jgi:hypothetical protein
MFWCALRFTQRENNAFILIDQTKNQTRSLVFCLVAQSFLQALLSAAPAVEVLATRTV